MKKYINPLLTAGTLLALLTTIYFQNERINQFKVEVKTYQTTVDSLQSELFQTQSQTGRYEVALELFKESNKKAADEFELILSTQTE
jgi:hypothetical protein